MLKQMKSKKVKKESSFNIKDLLSKLDIDINCRNSGGMAPLHVYAETNNIPLGALLISGGVDINVKTTGPNNIGKAPLHLSAIRGHKDFVKLLLKYKANVNEQDNIEHRAALHFCVNFEHEEIADILLDAGADVNLGDGTGATALHIAVRNGSEKLVKLLLEKDAVINKTNDYGKTALHYSAGYGKNDIVKLLLKAGASENIKDNGGRTVLLDAALYGFTVTALTLMEYTDDLDACDRYNNTALHYSSQNGHTEVVKALLEAGANVDMRGHLGRTPLWCSVLNKNIDVMKEIIEHGANLDIKDDSGQTALDGAIMYSKDEAVAVLRQHGAKSSKENKETMDAVLNSSKSEMEFKQVIARAGTSFASDNTTQSTDTALPMDTTPTASTTTSDASDYSTPSTETAQSIDTIPTACFVTPFASVQATLNKVQIINSITTTDTSTPLYTTPTMCTTTTAVSSTNNTPLITTSTTTSTTPSETTQFKKSRKSTNKMYKTHQKHNLKQTKLDKFEENRQTISEKHDEMLDDSNCGQTDSLGLRQTKDLMIEQEKTSIKSTTKNRRKKDKKKIVGKKITPRSTEDINNKIKRLKSKSSIMETKLGGYKRASSGSVDALKCRTKNNRKRKRTSNYQFQHQNRMKTICFYYIRKYFWKYKSNAKKRIKEKYNIDTNLEVKSFTNTNTFDGNYIGVGKVTRMAQTKSLAREDGSFSKLELKRALNYAINTEKLKKFRKQNVGRERKAAITVILNFIRDCNEVNIEKGDKNFINCTIVEDRKEEQVSKGV